jgi:hypothetical protein
VPPGGESGGGRNKKELERTLQLNIRRFQEISRRENEKSINCVIFAVFPGNVETVNCYGHCFSTKEYKK